MVEGSLAPGVPGVGNAGTLGKGGVGLRITHSLRCMPQAGGDVAGWKPNSIQLFYYYILNIFKVRGL